MDISKKNLDTLSLTELKALHEKAMAQDSASGIPQAQWPNVNAIQKFIGQKFNERYFCGEQGATWIKEPAKKSQPLNTSIEYLQTLSLDQLKELHTKAQAVDATTGAPEAQWPNVTAIEAFVKRQYNLKYYCGEQGETWLKANRTEDLSKARLNKSDEVGYGV